MSNSGSVICLPKFEEKLDIWRIFSRPASSQPGWCPNQKKEVPAKNAQVRIGAASRPAPNSAEANQGPLLGAPTSWLGCLGPIRALLAGDR